MIGSFRGILRGRAAQDILQVGDRAFRIPAELRPRVAITEKWMGKVLEALFPHFPGTFVDVGVNLGQTLLTVRSLDDERAYVGFEPNITCASYVHEIVRLNGFQNTTVLPVALFERSEVLRLYMTNRSGVDDCATVIEDFRPGKKIAESRTVLGISPEGVGGLFEDRIGVVKIDVEGAEFSVLQALRPFLERDRAAVVVEILPAYSADRVARVRNNADIEALCAELGYRLLRIVKGSKIGFTEIDEIGIHGKLDRCDYVLSPREAPQIR